MRKHFHFFKWPHQLSFIYQLIKKNQFLTTLPIPKIKKLTFS